GPLAMEGRAIVREVRDRVKVGGSAILSAALPPAPLGVDGIPSQVAPRATLPLIAPLLRAKARDDLAQRLVQSDLTTFRTEVTKRGAEPDRAAVKKYIDEFIKERGLAHGATTEPRDQYSLVLDPGLAPLREAYMKAHGAQDVLLQRFAAP